MGVLIGRCRDSEFQVVYEIINDAAQAYEGFIPSDRWKTPYMSREELRMELDEGVVFYGYRWDGELVGVMGIQDLGGVTLIRHAYVRKERQRRGVGGRLLSALREKTVHPILIGTWEDAVWAVRFYEKHGFKLVSSVEKDRLLRRYWNISERQVETSAVLADHKWFEVQKPKKSGGN